jgi:hypothetical protein
MTPKFTSLGLWGILKLAFLFQVIGLSFAVVVSVILSAVFPSWVRATMDMDQWNFPMTVTLYGGYVSIILFPFTVFGSWIVALLSRRILRSKNTEQADTSKGHPADVPG